MKKVHFTFCFVLVIIVNTYAQPHHLVYSSFLTCDSSSTFVTSSCMDSQGNFYVAGKVSTANLPVNEFSFDNTLDGVNDGFIMQIKSDNQIGWCTYFGGGAFDRVDRISCENDTLYVSLATASGNDLSSPSALYSAPPLANNNPFIPTMLPFVSTWDLNGQMLYGSFLSNYFNWQNYVLYDGDHLIFKNGFYILSSQSQLGTTYINGTSTEGQNDGYYAVIDKTGTLVYDSFVGGNKNDMILNMTADDDYIYCTLSSNSDTASYLPANFTPSGSSYLVALKVNRSNSNIEWSYVLEDPSSSFLYPHQIFRMNNGHIYLHLHLSGISSYPIYGIGGIQSVTPTENYLIELDSNGIPLWSSYLPTNIAEAKMVEYQGNLLMCSFRNELTSSPQTPNNWGFATGPYQGYVMELSESHDLVFASYFGGNDAGEYYIPQVRGNKLYAFVSTAANDVPILNEFSCGPSIPSANSSYNQSLFMYIFDDAVNIEEAAGMKSTMQLFPSPTSSYLSIQLPTNDIWTVCLFNMNGQVVSTEKINGNNRLDLNLQNFTSGLYTVQAMNENGKVHTEVVVKE